MNLITPDSGLLFWMVLIFGLVLFILAKWGFPAITSAIEKRNTHIAESLRMAAEAESRMAQLGAEQARLIEQTKAEQGKMLKEAARTRDEILAKAREDAEAQTARMIAQAKAEIDAEREGMMRDVRRQVATLSVEVAEKVLRKPLSSDSEQVALIDRLVDESASAEIKKEVN